MKRLNKKIILIFVVICVLGIAKEPNVVWTRTYGGDMGDFGSCVQQTEDGGFVIVGTTYSFGAGDYDIYLVKTDGLGNVEWSKTFGGTNREEGYYVQQTQPDKGFIIVGSTWSFGVGLDDVYLIKTDASGNEQWYQTYGWTSNEVGYCVQQTVDEYGMLDGYIIVGVQLGADPGNVYLIKTDLNGNELWSRTFGGNQADVGLFVQQTHPDRGYIIVGNGYTPNNGQDIYLIKTDPYGYEQWSKKFGGVDFDRGRGVQQTYPDDGYIIVGELRTPEGIFMALIKTDATGNEQWRKLLRPSSTSAARGYSVQQTEDGGYIAVGEAMLEDNLWYIYAVKIDKTGNIEWEKTIDVSTSNDNGYCVDLVRHDEYIITGKSEIDPYNPPYCDVCLVKLGDQIVDTDDPLALAYNGNRHLLLKPNSDELHLVYTRTGHIVYQYSSDGWADWYSPGVIGSGKFPALALSSDNLPSVAWIDDDGGLWYRRQVAPGQWGQIYHLYDPWGAFPPLINSPPSIAITPTSVGDSVHIICTLHSTGNGPINWVGVYSFQIDQPMLGSFSYIEGGVGPNAGAVRYNPSIVRCEIDNSLHAVWQRADTICYATRQLGQAWQNWGWQFSDDGLRSAHPFIESYGDMVYVVWQHKETAITPEEVYKAKRQLAQNYFRSEHFSLTPNTKSLYPVNAAGMFTVYSDRLSPFPDPGLEVFYKVHPADESYNISQTTIPNSFYAQSSARLLSPTLTYLYTAWQDGDGPVYEIRFRKIRHIPIEIPPYFSSPNGFETPSPYLVQRDTFIADWQIPVDVGYETITYQFPLVPGYRYQLKVIAYQQSSGEWREWVKIDNKWRHQIKYNVFKAETLECWIPPAFYKDSLIELTFERKKGDFATAGPIYIYRYEYEEGEGGGPMAQENQRVSADVVTIFPNPFREKVNIKYQPPKGNRMRLRIYDIAGRLVKRFDNLTDSWFNSVVWAGRDEDGRAVPAGIYFLVVENVDTDEFTCRKIIKVE